MGAAGLPDARTRLTATASPTASVSVHAGLWWRARWQRNCDITIYSCRDSYQFTIFVPEPSSHEPNHGTLSGSPTWQPCIARENLRYISLKGAEYAVRNRARGRGGRAPTALRSPTPGVKLTLPAAPRNAMNRHCCGGGAVYADSGGIFGAGSASIAAGAEEVCGCVVCLSGTASAVTTMTSGGGWDVAFCSMGLPLPRRRWCGPASISASLRLLSVTTLAVASLSHSSASLT